MLYDAHDRLIKTVLDKSLDCMYTLTLKNAVKSMMEDFRRGTQFQANIQDSPLWRLGWPAFGCRPPSD